MRFVNNKNVIRSHFIFNKWIFCKFQCSKVQYVTMDCIVDDPSTSRCSCCDSLTSPEVLGGFPEISVCELRDAVATSESSLVRLKAVSQTNYLSVSFTCYTSLLIFYFQILSYFSQREDCCVYKCVEGLPVSIKDYIYSEFKRAGRQSLQYFFEYLMTTMAETISRGFYVLGFKVSRRVLALPVFITSR